MRMVRTAGMVGAMLATAGPMIAGAQTVVTFESGATCDNATPVTVVQGVDFRGQWLCYGFEQPAFSARSSTNRLYASSGGMNSTIGSFGFPAPAVFTGAYFSGSANVSFSLFFGGALVGTSSTLATTATPTFLASGYGGLVDAVTVTGSSEGYVMDDVSFVTVGPTATTPEPASFALVGGGLLAVGAWRRRVRARTG